MIQNFLKILLVFISANVVFVLTFAQQIKFKQLTVENGLSQSVVNCMLEDRAGFLWFGTQDGLNRFDGYNFKIFRHDSKNVNSLSDNDIWSLYEDDSGKIWIGTQSGNLNCFDPTSEKFRQYNLDSTNKSSGNSITCIYEGGDSVLWIGTYKGGLYKIDIATGVVKNWQYDPVNPNSLSNNYVTAIFKDIKDNLWIGTHNGLCLFHEETAQDFFARFYYDPLNINSLSNNTIWTFFQSAEDTNHIWIGTYNGLTLLDIKNKIFTRIVPDQSNPDQFSRSISSICEVHTGSQDGYREFWVGTYGGLLKLNLPADINSILQFDIAKLKFQRWTNHPYNSSSLTYNLINKVLVDRSGVLWITTQKGINYYSPGKDKFSFQSKQKYEGTDPGDLSRLDVQAVCQTTENTIWFGTSSGLFFLKQPFKKNKVTKFQKLSNQNIWSLAAGNSDDLWVGTYGNGLKHLGINSGKIKEWSGNQYDASNIGNAYVRAVLQDKAGFLWIGLWGGGLHRLNPGSGQITRWHSDKSDPNSLSYNDVWVIYEDKMTRIWIGTYGGGLNLFSPAGGGKFYKWLNTENSPKKLSSNNILSICESTNNIVTDAGKTILWIGTSNGLNKFSIPDDVGQSELINKVKIEQYYFEENISASAINSVLEDNKGNLWLTTGNGLIEFNAASGKIINTYSTSDGLSSNEFNPNSACKLGSGEIFIGSINGLNIFYPDSISQSQFTPPVILTDFLIFNQLVQINSDSPLKTSINTTKEITLSYDQNVFSFQFAALDYNAPEMIQYAYKMEGFDEDWIYCGKRRFVTYTNLDPGEYTFHVKATNSDGVWNNEGTTLSLIITPPFWSTGWFRTIMILVLLSIGPFIYYRRVTALKKEKRLQVEFSKQLIQSQEEERKRIASELHDSLGQDLLVIKNIALMNKDKNEQFDIISKTTSFAIDDVRRIAYNLHPYQLDRLGLTKAISSMFTNFEGASKIKFDNEIENVDGLFEKEKEINIYRIIQEGVNNIIKHSGADKASVKVQKLDGNLLVEIADNGKGFNLEFVRSDSKGFGLKNLENRVSFLGGEIEFSSSEEFKTIINITIPV